MPSRPRAPRDLLVAGLACLSAVLLYPGAVLRGESFFERDLHLDWYPRLETLGRCLREGVWPVWDPTIGFGQPLLADPGAQILYPGTWLALALPVAASYTGFVLAHLLLAALGTARLARRLGAGSVGAPAAAVFFVLSGPLQSSVNLWHHLAGVAWMPWVLLGVDRVARTPRVTSVIALALVAGLQILAGSADVCAMTLVLSVVWVGFRLTAPPRRRRLLLRALAGLLASSLLAAAVTAGLWWPAADVVSRSARRELPEDIRTAWSLTPTGTVRLLLPLDPGRLPFDPARWQRVYDRPVPPFFSSLDLGLPVLGLGLLAVASPRLRRRAIVLGGAAALAVGLALGPHAPLYPLVSELVPPLKMFRYPTKALLAAALLVALLGGLGVGALARGRLRGRAVVLVATTLVLAAGSAWTVARELGATGLGVSVGAAVVAASVLLLRSRWRLPPVPTAAALALLGAGDLVAAHAGLHATAAAALVLAPPRTVEHVDRSEGRRLYVFDYHSLPGTAERYLGRSDPYALARPPGGGDARRAQVAAMRLYLVPPSAGLFGIEGSYDLDIRGLYPRPLNDLTFFLRRMEATPVHARLLRMGAVSTVLSLHERGLGDLRLDRALPSPFPEAIRVWRVSGAHARSWVVGRSRVAQGRAAFEALADPAFDPTREVLLPEGEPLAGADDFEGRSRRSRVAPDRVVLQVEASAPGFVVLADAFDPGWRATVDGQPAIVHRANVAFRAVAIPPGRHAVEMVYRPRPVVRGLTLSASSLVAALVLAAARATRARGGRRG